MRMIPTWLHGVLDYPLGLLMILMPWLGGFADVEPAMWTLVIAGGMMLVLSAMTNYEAGIIRTIPMPGHLVADGLMGVIVASSPWLFNFADAVYLPHLILGLGEIGAAMMTERWPRHARIPGIDHPSQPVHH